MRVTPRHDDRRVWLCVCTRLCGAAPCECSVTCLHRNSTPFDPPSWPLVERGEALMSAQRGDARACGGTMPPWVWQQVGRAGLAALCRALSHALATLPSPSAALVVPMTSAPAPPPPGPPLPARRHPQAAALARACTRGISLLVRIPDLRAAVREAGGLPAILQAATGAPTEGQ